jgi:hypothetical protein
VRHVRLHQVARGQSRVQTELTGQDGSGHNAGEFSCVVAGVGQVGTTDSQHVKNGTLRLKDGTASDGADFDGGHGDGNAKVAFGGPGTLLVRALRTMESVRFYLSMTVIQFEDSTFWAGSCPVAKKIAVTMLAA